MNSSNEDLFATSHSQTSDHPTYPLYHTTRKKPRRWPLVLRFIKGAVHINIALPVLLHTVWAAFVAWLEFFLHGDLSLPSSIVPSLSIVVGLMLVFRNQTSYDRFWQGNNHITAASTSIRNLTRSFLTCSYAEGKPGPTPLERAETERIVRILVAMMYATKNHLRAEWGQTMQLLPSLLSNGRSMEDSFVHRRQSTSTTKPEYDELLPRGTRSFEDQGLGLLLQLSVEVEAYIKRGHDRGWFHAPQASQLSVQLNTIVAAYGNMETIHLTPLPVASLIHLKQVMALFGLMLPFGIVAEMGWWTIPMTGVVMFTLYGIEEIGSQLEDPFGTDKNDIKVDAIVEDLRVETGVLLEEWRQGSHIFFRNKLV